VLSGVDTVVLDKTGTLTYGNPEVTGIRPASSATAQDVLATAAIAERPSEHPLARANLRKAYENNLSAVEPDGFNYLPGKGLVCFVDNDEIVVGNKTLLAERSIELNSFGSHSDSSSEILVARGGRLLGAVQIADRL